MERFVELGRLFDFYGGLLTDRQRQIVRQYAYEDCSLSEIAEREGVSRQAVRDAIRHAEVQLAAYEQKLGLAGHAAAAAKALAALNAAIAKTALPADEKQRLTAMAERLNAIWEDEDDI